MISLGTPPKAVSNLGLARSIAQPFAQRDEPVEDTEEYAIASVVLVEAEKKYAKGDYSCAFSTFVWGRMKGAITNHHKKKQREATIRLVRSIVIEEDDPWIYEVVAKIMSDHPEDTKSDRHNRKILMDFYLEGKSWINIARARNLPSRHAARQRAVSAMRKIRERFSIEGLDEI